MRLHFKLEKESLQQPRAQCYLKAIFVWLFDGLDNLLEEKAVVEGLYLVSRRNSRVESNLLERLSMEMNREVL